MKRDDRSRPPIRRDGVAADESDAGPRRYSRAETVSIMQGIWFLITGIWPFVSMRSFEKVTGPKPEGWLVKTVGGLVGVVGGAMVVAGLRRRVTPELAAIGAGTATVLAGIDVVYAARRRISPVYLGDAAAEGVLIAGWASAARDRDEPRPGTGRLRRATSPPRRTG
jgi:hypothetical protein